MRLCQTYFASSSASSLAWVGSIFIFIYLWLEPELDNLGGGASWPVAACHSHLPGTALQDF